MFDEYGNKIVAMIQGKFIYSIPNHGQIPKHFFEESFYQYKLITNKGTESGMSTILNVVNAERLAKNNNLIIIKSLEDFRESLDLDLELL